MSKAAKLALAVGVGLVLLMWLVGCGEPGNRPYCAVCDATGLCRYEPFERQDAADAKAAFWGGGQSLGIRPIPALPAVPAIPPVR